MDVNASAIDANNLIMEVIQESNEDDVRLGSRSMSEMRLGHIIILIPPTCSMMSHLLNNRDVTEITREEEG